MVNSLVVIIILGVIIVLQFIERNYHLYIQQKKEERLLEEISRATKAVISKNANDYVMTTAIDKVAPEEPPKVDNDLVSEDTLTDDEFMKAIHKDIE